MTDYSFVYITTGDVDEARRIAQELVELRLAACANILSRMESVYRWEGKICNENEAVLIAKTKTALLSQLTKKVKSIHSYDCPCIVALPIQSGYSPFLDWIDAETRSPE